jgi:hypothetical protein
MIRTWDKQKVNEIFKRNFPEHEFVTVSNRQPYIHNLTKNPAYTLKYIWLTKQENIGYFGTNFLEAIASEVEAQIDKENDTVRYRG